MGKIRVKTLGIDEIEKQEKKEALKRKDRKKVAKVPGLKGGQRIAAVGPTEEELAKLATTETQKETEPLKQKLSDSVVTSKTSKAKPKILRSKKYQVVAKMVDRVKTYSLKEGLELLSKIHLTSFDETVELHINTIQKGLTATTTLPHGTGKKVRVAIANDQIISDVSKGKVNFDVLLAEPSIMPKLAKVAKYLGPRGLMPNPKNNTITTNPKELAKKFEGGQTTLKTEAKSPIMHLTVGKLSFGADKLMENIQTLIEAIKKENIKNITLKSTMSPGIKIQLD